MENASKALLIAGGVLIAIIVITTLLYSFQQWGFFPKAKEQNTLAQQLTDFNQGFESYNRRNLYGADVLTVINKAIDNNDRYDAKNEDPYYVEVKLIMHNDVYGYTATYTTDVNGNSETQKTIDIATVPTVESGHVYTITDNKEKLQDLCNPNPVKVTVKKTGKILTRIEVYSAEKEFRVKYFTCNKMTKNQDTGRVNYIEFEEVPKPGQTLYDL